MSSYSSIFGELRSILNQRPFKTPRFHEVCDRAEEAWKLDPARFEDELLPFLTQQLSRWPVELRTSPSRWEQHLSSRPAYEAFLPMRLVAFYSPYHWSPRRLRALGNSELAASVQGLDLSDALDPQKATDVLPECEGFTELRSLYITNARGDMRWAQNLADAGTIFSLQRVGLVRCDLSDGALGEIAASGALDGLRELDLRECTLGYSDLSELLADDSSASLRWMHTNNCRRQNEHVQLQLDDNKLQYKSANTQQVSALLNFKKLLPRITHLKFNQCSLSKDFLYELGNDPRARHIKRLDLGNSDLPGGGLEKLANSPLAGQLTHLDLHHTRVSSKELAALARAPELPNLSSLNLSRCQRLKDKGIIALFRATNLPALKELNLRRVGLTDKGLGHLTSSRQFTALERLDLSHNQLSHLGLELLLSSDALPSLRGVLIEDLHLTNDERAELEELARSRGVWLVEPEDD